ncbi:MAG: YciI family protein [Gammaproteobacteria bacterium]|nr:YciI family protein [Gammaproteobacteria bacterium]
MFIVLLKFSANKAQASALMDGHNEWIKNGFDAGVFLVVGGLQPSLGGGIVAHNTSLEELQSRVSKDPFVSENVVSAEIIEISPARVDERLEFMLKEPVA